MNVGVVRNKPINKEKPVVVLDADGVLLVWQTHIVNFCVQKGFDTKLASSMHFSEKVVNPFVGSCEDPQQAIREYNSSKHMETLIPYPDAIDFVRENKDKYTFVVATAMSSNVDDLLLRAKNLKYFGDNIDAIYGCDPTETKEELFFRIVDDYDDENIVAFVDDQAHNLNTARWIFGIGCKLFHVIRGIRESSTTPCLVVNKLNQIELGE